MHTHIRIHSFTYSFKRVLCVFSDHRNDKNSLRWQLNSDIHNKLEGDLGRSRRWKGRLGFSSEAVGRKGREILWGKGERGGQWGLGSWVRQPGNPGKRSSDFILRVRGAQEVLIPGALLTFWKGLSAVRRRFCGRTLAGDVTGPRWVSRRLG